VQVVDRQDVPIHELTDAEELWRNLGDDGVRKAAYRGG
jgi:hypothetical protein